MYYHKLILTFKKKIKLMEQLSKIDTEILPDEVKKELLMFYEFLLYKESPNKKKSYQKHF